MKYNYFRDPIFFLKNFIKVFDFSFKTSLNYWIKKGEDAWLISKSTWSIVLLIFLKLKEKDEKINIWIPSYYCGSVIDIISKLNVSIYYFELNKDMSIDCVFFKKLLQSNSPDILILVHNFSSINYVKLNSLISELDTWIVEDATQHFIANKNIGKIGHFVLYSPYKFLPINSTAILVKTKKAKNIILNKKIFKDILNQIEFSFANDISSKFFDFKKFIVLTIKQFLILLNVSKFTISKFEISIVKHSKLETPKLNFWNRTLFKLFSNQIESISEKRRSNLVKLQFVLNNINNNFFNIDFLKKIIVNINDNSTLPLTFPIPLSSIINSKNFYHSLSQMGIEVNTWPDLPKQIVVNEKKHKNTFYLRQSIIHFPIHQSISLDDKELEKLFLNFTSP